MAAPNFNNRFEGTARFYARYRPDYPPSLARLLTDRCHLDAGSSVLDLGCGTGGIAVMLAPLVATVTGVDPDDGMLAEAEKNAAAGGVRNAGWIHATAEEFLEAAGTYQLITVGSAFHWMDRPLVAAAAFRHLKHGGTLAIVDGASPLILMGREAGLGQAITAVIARWLGPAGVPRQPVDGATPHEEFLRDSPLTDFQKYRLPWRQEWDVETLLGFVQSASWHSRKDLDGALQDLTADLQETVLVCEPSGCWTLDSQVEVLLAR